MALAGIATLIRTDANDTGIAVRIVTNDRIVLRPLELTGLIDDLAIYPDLRATLTD